MWHAQRVAHRERGCRRRRRLATPALQQLRRSSGGAQQLPRRRPRRAGAACRAPAARRRAGRRLGAVARRRVAATSAARALAVAALPGPLPGVACAPASRRAPRPARRRRRRAVSRARCAGSLLAASLYYALSARWPFSQMVRVAVRARGARRRPAAAQRRRCGVSLVARAALTRRRGGWRAEQAEQGSEGDGEALHQRDGEQVRGRGRAARRAHVVRAQALTPPCAPRRLAAAAATRSRSKS